MTRSHISTRQSPTQVEAAAVWIVRCNEGALANAKQAALDVLRVEAYALGRSAPDAKD